MPERIAQKLSMLAEAESLPSQLDNTHQGGSRVVRQRKAPQTYNDQDYAKKKKQQLPDASIDKPADAFPPAPKERKPKTPQAAAKTARGKLTEGRAVSKLLTDTETDTVPSEMDTDFSDFSKPVAKQSGRRGKKVRSRF